MGFRDALAKELLFFDGAMGTMMQAAGLAPGEAPDIWSVTHPDAVRGLHAAYLDAGCNIILANTFGCNAYKLAHTGYTPAEVATAAVLRAKEAIAEAKGPQKKFVALDIGPTGRLMKPLGDMEFEEAVSLFSETISAGAAAGADFVQIETMSDTYELKAAVLAAKESCDLPVCATVVLDLNGRLLTGGDIHSVVSLLEGLRVDALGLNCGLGPKQMLPFLEEIRGICSLPVILNPNAGLPREENGVTVFDVGPEEFAALMQQAARGGAHLLGGCCGITPAHIRALIEACSGIAPLPVEKKNLSVASSYGRAVYFNEPAVLIGERINPTGKPQLKKALQEGDLDHILREALLQQEHGAQMLDVNVGVPGLDEPAVLTAVMQQVQSVTDLPLQLDTADPAALERSLRLYNGKAMVNSVNGKRSSMDAVFPLVQKYGGVVVALTLDETGIPETAEGRLAIARRIVERAAQFGIEPKDIVVDTLTMTISAGQQNALVTLDTLRRVKAELGVKTSLGVSNVSFGLPGRELLNSNFLTLAMGAGLDAAIMNPHAEAMMDAWRSAQALLGLDAQCARFIEAYANRTPPAVPESPSPGSAPSSSDPTPQGAPSVKNAGAQSDITLEQAVRQGLKKQAHELAEQALKMSSPLEVIDSSLVPALNAVGEAFEKGTLFLPQLLMSADAAKAAFGVLRAAMSAEDGAALGCVVLATVEGDVHDIGKNIVKALLENYRFRVIDLGKNVPVSAVAEAAIAHKAKLVGLSALMTTTVGSMAKTIEDLRQKAPACKVMVGGAVLSEGYAKKIGADCYGRDAMAAVRYAQQVYA
ncbi:MAG: homocysteine S-methyltransferase family protein [Bacillota bacterium]